MGVFRSKARRKHRARAECSQGSALVGEASPPLRWERGREQNAQRVCGRPGSALYLLYDLEQVNLSVAQFLHLYMGIIIAPTE